MLKLIYISALLSTALFTQSAHAGCVNSPTTDNLERDKACKNITSEQQCLSTTDQLKCDWSITHTPPDNKPSNHPCLPQMNGNNAPNPKDGACLNITTKAACEKVDDGLNCVWKPEQPDTTVTGCLPNAAAGQPGNPRCIRIYDKAKCESKTDALNCKWVDPRQNDEPAPGTRAQ